MDAFFKDCQGSVVTLSNHMAVNLNPHQGGGQMFEGGMSRLRRCVCARCLCVSSSSNTRCIPFPHFVRTCHIGLLMFHQPPAPVLSISQFSPPPFGVLRQITSVGASQEMAGHVSAVDGYRAARARGRERQRAMSDAAQVRQVHYDSLVTSLPLSSSSSSAGLIIAERLLISCRVLWREISHAAHAQSDFTADQGPDLQNILRFCIRLS